MKKIAVLLMIVSVCCFSSIGCGKTKTKTKTEDPKTKTD